MKLERITVSAATVCGYCGARLEPGDAAYSNPRKRQTYGIYCHIDWSKPKFQKRRASESGTR